MVTTKSVANVINPTLCTESVFKEYQQRLTEGLPTRDENSVSHFCVYFLPYNKINKQVFLVHHKKSGLWIAPGGHIDKGETLVEALNREIDEELGVKNFFTVAPASFLLTITQIENPASICKTHYDIWFLVPTDGASFNVDPTEFYATKWLTIEEAEEIVTSQVNRQALEIVKNF